MNVPIETEQTFLMRLETLYLGDLKNVYIYIYREMNPTASTSYYYDSFTNLYDSVNLDIFYSKKELKQRDLKLSKYNYKDSRLFQNENDMKQIKKKTKLFVVNKEQLPHITFHYIEKQAVKDK